jgi:two-component system, chemotaxis family, chemotaxis protein CheY
MKSVSILVIERDKSQNDSYVKTLRSAGHQVEAALDGKSAISIIDKGFEPDIIFLDLRDPDIEGINFLKKYKPSNHPHAAVVVFSNFSSHTGVDQAHQLGVHRYIVKSRASSHELLRIVDSIVSERSSIDRIV